MLSLFMVGRTYAVLGRVAFFSQTSSRADARPAGRSRGIYAGSVTPSQRRNSVRATIRRKRAARLTPSSIATVVLLALPLAGGSCAQPAPLSGQVLARTDSSATLLVNSHLLTCDSNIRRYVRDGDEWVRFDNSFPETPYYLDGVFEVPAYTECDYITCDFVDTLIVSLLHYRPTGALVKVPDEYLLPQDSQLVAPVYAGVPLDKPVRVEVDQDESCGRERNLIFELEPLEPRGRMP